MKGVTCGRKRLKDCHAFDVGPEVRPNGSNYASDVHENFVSFRGDHVPNGNFSVVVRMSPVTFAVQSAQTHNQSF